MEEQYAAEVEKARDRIRELRDRMVQRCIIRAQNKFQGRGGYRPRLDLLPQLPSQMTDAQCMAEQTLSKLLASSLLETSTRLPVDVLSVHKKVLLIFCMRWRCMMVGFLPAFGLVLAWASTPHLEPDRF